MLGAVKRWRMVRTIEASKGMNSISKRRVGRPANLSLRERRREEILDVAARLFAERGFHHVDVQLVANELGVGKGTVYRYFARKEKLFLAAVDRVIRRLKSAIDARLEGVRDPMERIEGAMAAYLEFFSKNSGFVELIIQERAQFKDRRQPTYFEHRDVNIGPWRSLLQDLITEGRIRAVPVERIITVISDLLYGTMFTNYFTRRRASYRAQSVDILDIVCFGILSDRERKRRLAEASACPAPTPRR